MDVVRITELQPKTYVEQGDYIAIDNQSDGTKKVQFTNLLDDTLSQENKIAPANVVGDEIATVRDTMEDEIATIRAAVGSPLKASTVAQMTDKNKIYVYVGSESGYTNGNWYYWNGSAWTSGGVYNSVAVVTDPTLTLSGVPADAKATGDEIGNLKSDLNGTEIEGYTKGDTYIDCTATAEKTTGAYCYNGYVDNVVKMLSVNIASYNWYVLPVAEGEVYHIRTVTANTPRAYYFAKADGTYISRFPSASESEATVYDEIVTIPNGVDALYVNEFLNTSEAFIFEKKVNGFTYNRNADWYSFDSLYGKKLACVGDSMTEATNPNGGYFQNYAQIVAMRHNMEVYKDGVGGSTMANVSGHNAFSDARYLNVPSDYDILTIWFGWNDATYATVGTIDDETDDTFYGAYNKVLEYFIATYPTKKIGLIVPYGNSSVEPFRVAVRNLSEKFGVPCLDLTNYNQCSCIWGTANESQEARRSALTYDGTHPNQDGHIYLSTMYEEFIKRL